MRSMWMRTVPGDAAIGERREMLRTLPDREHPQAPARQHADQRADRETRSSARIVPPTIR